MSRRLCELVPYSIIAAADAFRADISREIVSSNRRRTDTRTHRGLEFVRPIRLRWNWNMELTECLVSAAESTTAAGGGGFSTPTLVRREGQ